MCNIQSVFCHPSFLPRSMQPQNAPKGCLNRIGLSNTPAGPRCVRRAGGHAHAHAHAQGLQGIAATLHDVLQQRVAAMPPATHGRPSAGGGRRAVGARSRAAAAALRLDLLHGPALDRPAVDEAGREALRGRRPRSAARRARRVRAVVRAVVVCVWCVACDGGGGEGQGAPARSRRPPPRRRGPS